ncbi:MAG TPA: hypothetical protein VG369_04915 [Humibacter sp.]|jgi:hypothetical protein|nr:hypothetical protein [Humibacter sp.]
MTEVDPPDHGRLTGGRIAASIIVGVLAAALLWFFGVDTWFSVAVGCLIIAVGLAWAAYSGPSAVKWPQEKPSPLPGTRSDVTRLAWAFQGRRGSVREPGFRAVRELGVRRLARHGLDVDTQEDRAAVVALIGEQAYAALHPVRGILPSFGALTHCVDALEAIDRPKGQQHP